MNAQENGFHLICNPPANWVKRPRLARLIAGAALIGLGVFSAKSDWVAHQWRLFSDIEFFWAWGCIVLSGCLMTLHTWLNDSLHVHQIRVHPNGMTVQWSHVPALLGAREEGRKDINWNEVERIEWEEGRQEHDPKQHLVLNLKTPLNQHQTHFRLLLCDSQDFHLCEQLLAHIPRQIQAPSWFVKAQARRRGQIV